jgi:hypothetical protein
MVRNPQTIFVCWSVNWADVFGKKKPVDRSVHVLLRCRAKEERRAVEPMLGSCSLGELEPGETYFVELGYYAPAGYWNAIGKGQEVSMPSESADETPDVATIPFHLEFQRILEAFAGANRDQLARELAGLEERASEGAALTLQDEQRLHDLGLSPEALRGRVAYAKALAQSRPIRTRLRSGTSPSGSSSGS